MWARLVCTQVLRAQVAAPGQKVVAGALHGDQKGLVLHGTPLAVSHVVQGLPDVHGGGWRLLLGQVPLPELLVPGYKYTHVTSAPLYQVIMMMISRVGSRLAARGRFTKPFDRI